MGIILRAGPVKYVSTEYECMLKDRRVAYTLEVGGGGGMRFEISTEHLPK